MKRILFLFLVSISICSFAQDGTVDTSFGTNGRYTASNGFSNIKPSIVFNNNPSDYTMVRYAGTHNNQIALCRFEISTNGSIYPNLVPPIETYYPNSVNIPNFVIDNGYTFDAILNSNNETLALGAISGLYMNSANIFTAMVTKTLANGVKDNTFGTDGAFRMLVNENIYFNDAFYPNDFKLGNDGKIYVIGTVSNPTSTFLFKINQNGTSDNTFDSNGSLIIDFGDVYGSNTIGKDMIILPNNEILVCGSTNFFTTVFNGPKGFIKKISSTGQVVSTFGINSVHGATQLSDAHGMVIINDKIYLLCAKYYDSNWERVEVARLNLDGTLDATYGTNGKLEVTGFLQDSPDFDAFATPINNVTVDANNKILYTIGHKIYRINPTTATLDNTFATNGIYVNEFILNGAPIAPVISDIQLKNSGKLQLAGSQDANMYIVQLNYPSNTLEINDIENNTTTIKIYPNPTTETLNFSKEIPNYTISEISGRIVLDRKNTTKQINVSALKEGVYIISFEDDNGSKQSQKFIKK